VARTPNLVPNPKFHVHPSTGAISVSWTHNKKTIRRGCDTTDLGIARERFPGILATFNTPKPVANFTLGDLIDAYVFARERDPDRTKRPADTFAHNFRQVRFYFGAMKPAKLSSTTVADYRRWRQAQPVKGASKEAPRNVSDNTAVRELKQLRAAVKWGQDHPAYRDGLVGVGVKLPDVELRTIDRALTRSEVMRLLAVLAQSEHRHLELFVRLALATGARMGALLELTWDRVTWPRVTAPDLFTETTTTFHAPADNLSLTEPIRIDMGRGHGHKRRPSGLVDASNVGLWRALVVAYAYHRYKHPDAGDRGHLICLHGNGKRLAAVNLDDAYARAGIADVSGVHVLKHTCCTLMLLDGKDPRDVAELVNTSVEVIIRHYRNFLPAKRAEVGRALAFN
jgi:integrase